MTTQPSDENVEKAIIAGRAADPFSGKCSWEDAKRLYPEEAKLTMDTYRAALTAVLPDMIGAGEQTKPTDEGFRQWVEEESGNVILWMRTASGTHFRRSVLRDSSEGDVLAALRDHLTTSAPQPRAGVSDEVRKFTMPNGDKIEAEYPDSANWARSWIVRSSEGKFAATGEQDWEIVETYGLTAILNVLSTPTPPPQPAPLVLTEEEKRWIEAMRIHRSKTDHLSISLGLPNVDLLLRCAEPWL